MVCGQLIVFKNHNKNNDDGHPSFDRDEDVKHFKTKKYLMSLIAKG